jgi:2-polyprenyl-3-methyl-5-hydroxy-6-metoxy-1,4-benzoquinol methylase
MTPEPALCLYCGGDPVGATFPFSTQWDDTTFEYWRCGVCEAVFVAPTPTDAQFEKMYSAEAYHQLHYSSVDARAHRATADFVRRHLPGAHLRLLDYGCGAGAFLVEAAARGFEVTGAEFSDTAREATAQRTGLPIVASDILFQAGAKSPGPFDVIFMGDVLEHLPRPGHTLRALARHLRPEAVLCLEGPLQANPSVVYGLATGSKVLRRALKRDRLKQQSPTHLTLVSEKTQRHFFERVLGWHIEAFEIWETGWPAVYAQSPWTLSGKEHLKAGIGLLARAAAKLPIASRHLANRFRAIVRPQ